MLISLLIGSAMILVNLGIQVWAVTAVLRFLRRLLGKAGRHLDMIALGIIMIFLLLGHVLQFATWALLFRVLGEFGDFATAFYHSTVNFTSLGYGDLVMSERWRLLGALEAANGVLMFGLTAGLVLTVMTQMFKRSPAGRAFAESTGVDEGSDG